ncbi:C45 family autoproteolytic acyltransferase/hydolase [Streptomyces profundus]|uniref:C45 family autoproteolytic acyltransferase/hydolase n=1 Tax=Streptomyces profundus TaxID=2867410 RepID=UPI001D16508F|nr:C45 family peptidase [Streptomyces sp. MA3_2.13]UED83866.1 linear amide C-N hydrolase [Streptomyces sp. MA3_2.13]
MDVMVYQSPDERLAVRHMRIHGSNEEIGESLGHIARSRYRVAAEELLLPEGVAESRRAWAVRHYPELVARGVGIARAFGLDPADPKVDALGVGYHMQLPTPPQRVGCSVLAAPTVDAGTVVQRNFDFGFLSLPDAVFGPGAFPEAPAMLSEPYVMEIHPTDGGMSALFLCAFDLCNGVIDGMNEAGLVVSMMQLIDRTASTFSPPDIEPGLNELEVLRFILDRCRTVEDAQRVFEEQQTYLSWMPCHYIIADAEGVVMLAEPGDDNTTHTVVKRDGTMRSTNHSLLRQIPESWENDPDIRGSIERLQRMDAHVAVDPEHPFTADRLVDIADQVAVSTQWPESGAVLGGTLWSASYRPRSRALAIRFWTGPGAAGSTPDLSPEMHFRLDPAA